MKRLIRSRFILAIFVSYFSSIFFILSVWENILGCWQKVTKFLVYYLTMMVDYYNFTKCIWCNFCLKQGNAIWNMTQQFCYMCKCSMLITSRTACTSVGLIFNGSASWLCLFCAIFSNLFLSHKINQDEC